MTGEILVKVFRGELIESIHTGHITVVSSEGDVLYCRGDPYKRIFARSSMKPVQIIPVVESGAAYKYGLNDEDLAVMCASHSGERMHTSRVKQILDNSGLEISHLACGVHEPLWEDVKNEYKNTPLFHMCSGKHTGMLLTALQRNSPLEDYYLLGHPLQEEILTVISSVMLYDKDQIGFGTDGCGVPVHQLPIYNIALGYARMTRPEVFGAMRKKAIQQITKAMTNAPDMVAGTNRFCTNLMEVANGRLFAKLGAEGVYCIGDVESRIGICLKIDDGNERAVYPAIMNVLQELDLLSDEQCEKLSEYHYPVILNGRGEKVGELRPSFGLLGG